MTEKPKRNKRKKKEKTFLGFTLDEWSIVVAILVSILEGISLFL